jgi:hypothetical protein
LRKGRKEDSKLGISCDDANRKWVSSLGTGYLILVALAFWIMGYISLSK